MELTTTISELAAARKFQFIGGNLALDFCNTVGGKRGEVVRECLTSPAQYIAWSLQAGLLDQTQGENCLVRAHREPEKAAAELSRAIDFREALFRIFGPCQPLPAPSASDLELLNRELSQALCRLRLSRAEGQSGLTWRWVVESDAMDQPLGPIAHAAATLLTDPKSLTRVRICHGDNCGWIFLDASKNHSRCWCEMRDCGNRAKIRRHRLKQRTGDSSNSR